MKRDFENVGSSGANQQGVAKNTNQEAKKAKENSQILNVHGSSKIYKGIKRR